MSLESDTFDTLITQVLEARTVEDLHGVQQLIKAELAEAALKAMDERPSGLHFKDVVPTVADLPAADPVRSARWVESRDSLYAKSPTGWIELSPGAP